MPLDLLPLEQYFSPLPATFSETTPPAPYDRLLCHTGNLTPALEAHHSCQATLDVLVSHCAENVLTRTVVLVTQDPLRRPLSIGAIKIFLAAIGDSAAVEEVRRGVRPLGTVLREHKVLQHSAPSGFFQVPAWGRLAELLGVEEGVVLFGRVNELRRDDNQALIASVVEVLARA